MIDTIVCHGCGQTIQTEDETKPGFAPKEALLRPAPLCKRCFRLQNYGEFQAMKLQNEKFLDIIKASNDEDCLVIYVIDILNFYGSLIRNLPELIKNPILIAINKIDLLPKSIKIETILSWVKEKLNAYHVPYVDIEVVSAHKKINIDSLFAKINRYSNHKSVYIIGNTNVGKSTIINAILKTYSNNTKEMITSSVYPGTTLKTIKIPFDDGCFLYDTPGLLDPSSILNHISEKSIRIVVPNDEIKPVNYQSLLKQSIFIGSIARVDFTSDIGASMIFYMSNRIDYTRHSVLSFDTSIESKFNKYVLEGKKLPQGNNKILFSDLKKHSFTFAKRKRMSIHINGLGFIDIIAHTAQVDIYVPNGVEVILDEPMIGGKKNAK